MKTKNRHSTSHKAQIVLEVLREEKTIRKIASAFGVHLNQLHRWKKQAIEEFPKLFEDDQKSERAKEAERERQLQELYAEIGRLTTQVNWLKRIWLRCLEVSV